MATATTLDEDLKKKILDRAHRAFQEFDSNGESESTVARCHKVTKEKLSYRLGNSYGSSSQDSVTVYRKGNEVSLEPFPVEEPKVEEPAEVPLAETPTDPEDKKGEQEVDPEKLEQFLTEARKNTSESLAIQGRVASAFERIALALEQIAVSLVGKIEPPKAPAKKKPVAKKASKK